VFAVIAVGHSFFSPGLQLADVQRFERQERDNMRAAESALGTHENTPPHLPCIVMLKLVHHPNAARILADVAQAVSKGRKSPGRSSTMRRLRSVSNTHHISGNFKALSDAVKAASAAPSTEENVRTALDMSLGTLGSLPPESSNESTPRPRTRVADTELLTKLARNTRDGNGPAVSESEFIENEVNAAVSFGFPFAAAGCVVCKVRERFSVKVAALEQILDTDEGKQVLYNETRLRWAFDNNATIDIELTRPSKV